MGLFSFLKNAGSKILSKKAEGKQSELNHEKAENLKNLVKGLQLPIKDFSVDVDGDTAVVYGETDSQADREKVILAVGNVEGIASVDDRISVVTPAPEAEFYTVKSGDSLSKIAKTHYGDSMKYMKIFEANKPMLKDPNLIYPGQVLRIPPEDK